MAYFYYLLERRTPIPYEDIVVAGDKFVKIKKTCEHVVPQYIRLPAQEIIDEENEHGQPEVINYPDAVRAMDLGYKCYGFLQAEILIHDPKTNASNWKPFFINLNTVDTWSVIDDPLAVKKEEKVEETT